MSSNGQPVYNDVDAHACAWLRNLCRAGYLRGRVVEADVRTLNPADVARGCRFHAFAGIGMWEYALQLAGWPDELPVWTGSCPCQPFSVAGRGGGTNDERHLWPAWFRLIRECHPPIIFGEQVASPAGLVWFDAVSADLEGEGYTVGAADLCAAGVGAPHIRQRLFFVAHRSADLVGEPDLQRREGVDICLQPRAPRSTDDQASRSSVAGRVGNAGGEGGGRDDRAVYAAQDQGRREWRADRDLAYELELAGYTRGFWADADWLLCRDGKARPVEPGTFPLAHGRAGRVAVVRPVEQGTHWYNRVGALKCIGNAIVPQVAAVFIEAALRSIHDQFA